MSRGGVVAHKCLATTSNDSGSFSRFGDRDCGDVEFYHFEPSFNVSKGVLEEPLYTHA